MLSKLKEIEEEALRLAPNERALLAERRYIAYKEGRVKAKPAELVFKEARSKLK